MKFLNGNTAGAARMRNYGKLLAEKNINVYFISSQFDSNIVINSKKKISEKVYVIGEPALINKSYFLKVQYPFRLFMFIKKIRRFADSLDGEVILYLYPSTRVLLDWYTIFYLRFLHKSNVFCEINELRKYAPSFSRKISFLKNIPKFILIKKSIFLFSITEYLSHYFNGLICISTNILNYYSKYNSNLLLIPILSGTPKAIPTLPKYQNNDTFNMCFTGFIDVYKENFDVFFHALMLLKQKKKFFKFNMYGPLNNIEKCKISKLLKYYQIEDNVVYHGFIESNKVQSVLMKNNLLISVRKETLQNKYGFSTKLSEYLVSGVPALITKVSDNSLYFKDKFNCFFTNPESPQQIAEKICDIINNYNHDSQVIGKNAIETTYKNFHYSNYSQSVSDFLF